MKRTITMSSGWTRVMAAALVLISAYGAHAAVQTWNDAGADNVWSTNAANWDAGSVWTNGNHAVFAGSVGETVDVAATVTVANVTFQTNGYTIADANYDGSLSVVGAPSVFTVSGAGNTATVSAAVGGSGGLTKAGNGLLQLKATNTYAGVTRVSAGVLKLNQSTPAALGAGGTGSETVVENGATLDFNGAYYPIGGVGGAVNVLEDLTVSGAGTDGNGALINTGNAIVNGGFRHLILAGNTVIGGSGRLDLGGANSAVVNGNGYTLIKTGSCDVAISRAITNCPIVVSAGSLTIQNGSAFGGTDYPTTLNGGMLYFYVANLVFSERFLFNGGTIRRTGQAGSLTLNGNITLNKQVVIDVVDIVTNILVLTGSLDGAGGFTLNGPGSAYVTGSSNTYSGPTVLNSGKLFVGYPKAASGVLGAGVVTNNALLFIDRGGAFVSSNAFFGAGRTAIRYGGEMTLSGGVSSSQYWNVSSGVFTLTNGAEFCAYNELSLADKFYVSYPADPTNVLAVVNVPTGCVLTAKAIICGNGTNLVGGTMTGILNQAGGVVRTTGSTAEDNGIRLGHYEQAYGEYNMRGGTLIVGSDYDLCIATDGKGWFRQTGGEVFASRVMLNERDSMGGYGRLTVEGGVLNIGSLSGRVQAISNSITTDATAPYLVEYGGRGGIIRAVTNIYLPLNATLYGTNGDAITFDTTNFAVSISGKLSGAGGLSKVGSGALLLTGTNTYSGGTAVKEGTLLIAERSGVPDGALKFGVSANGACGVLHATGDLSLTGLSVGVVNPEQLNRDLKYTVVTYGGTLGATFSSDTLPGPWEVYYDQENRAVKLRAVVGTLIRLR
jgi:autotransporter-associated beta strand protein